MALQEVGKRIRRKFTSANSGVLLGLLVLQAGYILWLYESQKADYKTELSVEPGVNYSLLVNGERIPIKAEPRQEIDILVRGRRRSAITLPKRLIIPEYREQISMGTVTESRFRFYYDSPSDLRPFYQQEHLAELRGKTDWDTIARVVAHVSHELKFGMPRIYPPQNAALILDLARHHHEEVFCAQFCYVTVQSLQALGYVARYITIEGHEVCEVWVPQYQKWVCLDPTNALYFEDLKGKKLSALEIASDSGNVIAMRNGRRTEDQEAVKTINYYTSLWFWLHNDLQTHPINIYDLNKYRVRAILNSRQLQDIKPGDLYTLYPVELYQRPSQAGL